MIIGERLHAIREKKRISLLDLERESGISRAEISRIESGHAVPSVTDLSRLALALDVPVPHLFFDPEHPTDMPRSLCHLTAPENQPKEGLEATGWLRRRLDRSH